MSDPTAMLLPMAQLAQDSQGNHTLLRKIRRLKDRQMAQIRTGIANQNATRSGAEAASQVSVTTVETAKSGIPTGAMNASGMVKMTAATNIRNVLKAVISSPS